MKVKVYFSHSTVDELSMREVNVCVIDVFRSSTIIATALKNGAREIIPIGAIANAVKVSGSLMGEFVVRGGERNGKKIDGFNLGNSPLEYTEEAVKGKAIIYCTTNGTVAITKSRYAKKLIIGGFVNISAVVSFINSITEDWDLVCAGRDNNFSFEDAVCAGMIIKLLKDESKTPIELNDSAIASLQLYKANSEKISLFGTETDYGKYLVNLNFEEDLKICTTIDLVPVLPLYSDNVIKLATN